MSYKESIPRDLDYIHHLSWKKVEEESYHKSLLAHLFTCLQQSFITCSVPYQVPICK